MSLFDKRHKSVKGDGETGPPPRVIHAALLGVAQNVVRALQLGELTRCTEMQDGETKLAKSCIIVGIVETESEEMG